MPKVTSLVRKVKLWPWALIARIAVPILAAVIVVLIYRQIVVVPGQLRQDNANAKQDTKAAQGEATMTRETVDTMQGRTVYRDRTREIVRENTREILRAPGASDPVPAGVNDAFVAAVDRLREQADQRDRAADQLPRDRP